MLEDLKRLIGMDSSEADPELDAKLNWILLSVKSRLKILLGGADPPEEMNYIVIEVAVARFNRIGSEGMSAQTVEGESLSFSDDDFARFAAEIQAFLDSQHSSGKGKVRFV